MINKHNLERDLELVRSLSPVVHSITNYVAQNLNANALLALGASPVMAHSINEVEDMCKISGALVINIGTLDSRSTKAMMAAGLAAHAMGKPIVLDPVGAGATPYRTSTSLRLIEACHPTIIRGNGSEIMALCDSGVATKGVDSSVSSNVALDAAKALALSSGAVVVISGETDYITDGERVETITSCSTMMTSVTSMGCTATAVVGAFAAINGDPFEAALHAMAVMGVAGERAAAISRGSGSLHVNFIDELYSLTSEVLSAEVKQ